MKQQFGIRLESNVVANAARRIGCLVAISTLLLSAIAHAQSFKDTYPRVANIPIKYSKNLSDPEFRQALAKFDIVILGLWRGYSVSDDVTGAKLGIRDVVIDIERRAQSIDNQRILIGKYTTFNESGQDPNSSAAGDKWLKLHSEIGPGYPRNNDWYARDKNGEHTSSWPGSWLTNVTEFVQRDANGDTYPEWAVRRDFDVFFRDIPECDMWYFDNWFYRPRVSADWDGDGINDDKNNAAVRRYFREGYANGLKRARELAPDMIFMGNVDGDPASNSGMLTEPEFRGQLTALYEAAIGLDHSTETWGGWKTMMQQYQTTLLNAQHNLVLLNVQADPDDYTTMRYGLASCLMDNGYFHFSSRITRYMAGVWFDEYDVDLGRAIDPPQYDEWQRGVFMRRFENGMVLVNPKGNGTTTVQIEPGYKRFSGNQDPVTNNGQTAESVTLRERDGLILVRVDGSEKQKRPKPPVLSSL